QLRVVESRGAARVEVERAAQTGRDVFAQQFGERGVRIAAFASAAKTEPARAGCDVRYFFAQDDFENAGGGVVADRAQPRDHAGRHVQSERFQHTWHQRLRARQESAVFTAISHKPLWASKSP